MQRAASNASSRLNRQFGMKGMHFGRFFCGRFFAGTYNNAAFSQPIRTTFILKRRHPVPPSPLGSNEEVELEQKHYVYDLVENINSKKQEPIDVILTTMVSGLGSKGDIVSVRRQFARQQLLLPGLAVYASPENIEEFVNKAKLDTEVAAYSSPFVAETIQNLERMLLVVDMNADLPWTMEPWHVRVALRRAGVIVPNEAVELPVQPIGGPVAGNDGKVFVVFVTINSREKVPVRCRLRHWRRATVLFGKEQDPDVAWDDLPAEPLLKEQVELLESMPDFEKKNT